MKSWLAYIFAILILLTSCRPLVGMLKYTLHKDYYMALCENRARPDMHCNGRCALEKETKPTRQPLELLKNIGEIQYVTADQMVIDLVETPAPSRAKIACVYRASLPQPFIYSIPHPPNS